jgi:tRNA(Ile)-lysidine synthetase-like protein
MSLHRQLLQRFREDLPPVEGQRLAVAVSGGLDSVVLLDLLHSIRRALRVELVVAHVDHGLRGAASAEDAAFVRGLAAERGLACYCGRFHGLSGRGVEDAARVARMAFLRGVPAQRVALAHHLDDVAETVLLRLLRSSSLDLLRGPMVERGPFLRPLLTVPRARLEAWADARDLRWREDASNTDPGRERNLLRSRVMPLLDEVHGGARERLVAMAREAEREVRAAEAAAEAAVQPTSCFMAIDALLALHPAQRVRVVRQHLDRRMGAGHGASRESIERVLSLVDAGRPGAWVPLPWAWRAASCGARIYCLPPPPVRVGLRLPGVRRWGVHDIAISRPLGDRDPVILRPPRPGERYRGEPLGEWLRRWGVPAPLRPYHPIFERRGGGVWVPSGGSVDGSVAPGGLAIRVTASIPSVYAAGHPWCATL